jgi:AcrR family transcriptional regulator
MGKSGLFDHFGSKQELELATVERATAILWREVVERAAAVEPGFARLRALVDGYLAYLERDTLPGLTAAGAEFDARRGPVRDAIAEAVRAWGRELETQVELARARNELPADTEPPQIDFELSALATRVNAIYQLYDDRGAYARARADRPPAWLMVVGCCGLPSPAPRW